MADSYYQGDYIKHPVLYELSHKYGLQTDNLCDSQLPGKLEELKDIIRREIRKELKIKEGAERLRGVSTDRKSLNHVATIVKNSNWKLAELKNELSELESQIILSQGQTTPRSTSISSNGDSLPRFSLEAHDKLNAGQCSRLESLEKQLSIEQKVKHGAENMIQSITERGDKKLLQEAYQMLADSKKKIEYLKMKITKMKHDIGSINRGSVHDLTNGDVSSHREFEQPVEERIEDIKHKLRVEAAIVEGAKNVIKLLQNDRKDKSDKKALAELPRRVIRSPKQKKLPAIFQQDKMGSASDSKSSDPSKKPRTVHIDVYCTGTEMESNASSSSSDLSENETASTPQTVFESNAMRVTHARADAKALPRNIQNPQPSSAKPATLQAEISKEESDMDDASVGYPSKMSSYSTIKDFSSSISSVPRSWTSYSMSSCTVPDDYDSVANTSWKDTFSDIDSLLQSRSSIAPTDSFDFVPRRLYEQTPSIDEAPEFTNKQFLPTPSGSSLQQSDSFEYANSEDKLRIKCMEEMLAKPTPQPWKSPNSERKQLIRQKKINEYVERRLKALSKSSKSKDSDSDGSDEDEKGWTFVKDDNKKLGRDTTVRRASKDMEEKHVRRPETIVEESSQEKQIPPSVASSIAPTNKLAPLNMPTEQGSLSDSSSSCSKSPSTLALRQRLSADPSLGSPFTIVPGRYTEQRSIARRFGPVVSVFKKPGHHVGPAKNPDCLCDHCKRFFEENGYRNRTRSLGDPPITPIQNWRDFIKSVNSPKTEVKKPPAFTDF